MLPGGLDPLYRAALASGQRLYTRIDVTDGNGNPVAIPAEFTDESGGLVYGDGSAVSATLNSRVTRNLTITLPQQLYPQTVDGFLAPYGNRLTVTRGLEWADGDQRYSWIVFTGRIQRPVLSPDGSVVLRAADRAYEVVEAGFVKPANAMTGSTVSVQFRTLISDGVPDAVFGVSDVFGQLMPAQTWESDRAGAADEISTTVGAFWYALADGRFVQRRYPWAVPSPSLLTLSDGVGGVIAGSPSRDREDVYNSITVYGERADGTLPVFAVAEDTNPLSRTFVGGPFGRRHRGIPLRTPQTQGSAQTAADAYLRRSVALQETWTWVQPPDAALELGDVVSLNAFDRTGIVQVVSGFTLPLDTGSMMTVQAHPQTIGALE